MRKSITAFLLVGAMSAIPVVGFAAPVNAQAAPAKRASASAVKTHSTNGVVKSIDSSMLVITGAGKNKGDMTFTLNSSTQREGTIAAGSPVSIRYRDDGQTHVATAIHAQQGKQQTASAASSKR